MPHPTPDKLLSYKYPEIAKEWNHNKNGNLKPSEVTYSSGKKAWWLCDKGHEWEAKISNRTKGQQCPYCSGRRVSNENCLATLRPDLALEWHPCNNKNLTPKDVTAQSNKTVWWSCNSGHEWEAKINNRFNGRGCPYCSGQRVTTETSLQATNPSLAAQWHPTLNRSLTPSDVLSKSNRYAWWICDKGHEWKATISNRSNGRGCPYCSGKKVSQENSLGNANRNLAKEWHPTKNGSLTPDKVTVGSNKRVWWQCTKGHEWSAVISSRSNGTGCPFCSGRRASMERNLARLNPTVSGEWDYSLNSPLTPNEVSESSNIKVWWKCSKGHEWQASVNSRTSGSGCPYCSRHKVSDENRFITHHPELVEEVHPTHNSDLALEGLSVQSSRKLWWKCKNGHEWEASVSNRVNGTGCPFCSNQSSMPEIRILSELETIFDDVVTRHKEDGIEIDVFIRSLNLGVEYDGSYWHKSKVKKDIEKTKKLIKRGIKLIRVREEPLLKLSEHDVLCSSGGPDKAILNSLVKSIAHFCVGNTLNRITKYLEHEGFVNEDKYQLYRSYFPSPFPENSLAQTHKNLSKEWNTEKNGSLEPKNFSHGSGVLVWWVCNKGHEWQASISNRARGNGCPICSGRQLSDNNRLSLSIPELANQWHPALNGELTPSDVAVKSSKLVWWKCKEGHEWKATVASRSGGNGCPYCSGLKATSENNFAAVYPELVEEWHSSKNKELSPNQVKPKSDKKVWWICSKGHEWQSSVKNRSLGRGCPYCSGRRVSKDNCLRTVNPDLAKQWHPLKNGDLTPDQVTPGSDKKVWWVCEQGHEWDSRISGRSRGVGCPICGRKRKSK